MNGAQCWHGNEKLAPDLVGTVFIPDCAPYPNYYYTSAAWTH